LPPDCCARPLRLAGVVLGISAHGGGSVLAACLLFWRLGLWKQEPATDLAFRGLRHCRRTGLRPVRVGSTVLSSICGQTQMFLVAGMLGLGAAGILPGDAASVAGDDASSYVDGASISSRFFQRVWPRVTKQIQHKALLVSLALAPQPYALQDSLAVFAGPIEHIFFGGKYGPYAWLMPFLALVPAASGFNQGFSLALRATQRPYFDLIASALAAPIGVYFCDCLDPMVGHRRRSHEPGAWLCFDSHRNCFLLSCGSDIGQTKVVRARKRREDVALQLM